MNEKLIHIIVVDDEDDARIIFKFNFKKEVKKEQLKIDYFASAREVLEFLQTDDGKSVDLILSDINMPEMDGLELLKKIREEDKGIKIYMVSAYGTEEFTARADELGANDFFTKPVNFDELKDKINEEFNLKKID